MKGPTMETVGSGCPKFHHEYHLIVPFPPCQHPHPSPKWSWLTFHVAKFPPNLLRDRWRERLRFLDTIFATHNVADSPSCFFFFFVNMCVWACWQWSLKSNAVTKCLALTPACEGGKKKALLSFPNCRCVLSEDDDTFLLSVGYYGVSVYACVSYHVQVMFSGAGNPVKSQVSAACSRPANQSSVVAETVASGGSDIYTHNANCYANKCKTTQCAVNCGL